MGIDPASTGSAKIMGISSFHPHGVLMDVSTMLTSDSNPPKPRRKGNKGMNCVCAAWGAWRVPCFGLGFTVRSEHQVAS